MNQHKTNPGQWLNRLREAASVESLREALRAQEPQLTPETLKRIALLGAGPEGQRFAEICRQRGIEIVGVYDGNVRKRGTKFAGKVVYPSDALSQLSRDVPIIIASHRVLGSYEALRAMGYIAVPLAYLQVAAPKIFAPHDFYDHMLEDLFENRKHYEELWEVVQDPQSRQILDAIIAYRLTFNPSHLQETIDWDTYGDVKFGPHEVYVDGGAYNGDSIQFFTDHVNDEYRKVFAFEPDKRTFDVLEQRFGSNPKVALYNKGLYDRSGTLGFTSDSSRAARFDDDSESRVEVVALDDVISEKVTFIKMNIEGAEIAALNGARNLLKTYSPKLAISAYHRASDLWQIPKLIGKLNNSYKFYLRQHDGGIIESVIYAVAEPS